MDEDEVSPLSLDEMAKVFEKAATSPHFESAVEEINRYIGLRGCEGRDETAEALRILMVAATMAICTVRLREDDKNPSSPVMH